MTGEESWLAGVDLIRSDNNLGFAAANNLAVARCPEAEWIALINPDAVPDEQWLAELENATRQFPGYDCFACRQLEAAQPDRLDGAGDGLTRAGRPFRRGYGQTAATDYTVADEVFSACGAAMLIRSVRAVLYRLCLLPLALLLFAGGGWWNWRGFKTDPEAVITKSGITALYGPVEGGTAHYKPPAGALVRQRARDPKGWVEIEYDGKKGWIKEENILTLSP